MQDLTYIISLGFSGSDIWRAVIIAFFAAMIVTKKRPAALLGLWALLVDRLVWPFTGMWMSGADSVILNETFSGMVQTFSADMGVYLVRYAGLVVMMTAFAHMRKRIHTPRFDKAKMKPKHAHA